MEVKAPELLGWIQDFLFPLKLCFWRCPERSPWTGARRESCPALGMHLPWRDVCTQHRPPWRGRGLHPWGWLSLVWTKPEAGAGRGPALGRRQEIPPLTLFCLWDASLCFFVAQTWA